MVRLFMQFKRLTHLGEFGTKMKKKLCYWHSHRKETGVKQAKVKSLPILKYLLLSGGVIATLLTLTACQKSAETTLIGCYTTSKTEPAQIKINQAGDGYTMQMREFNDPNQAWDTPEPMQILQKSEVKNYFPVEEKSVEAIIARPDHVFVLAKVTESLTSLDSRFDSPYLGFIYKGSNTIYKVDCGK